MYTPPAEADGAFIFSDHDECGVSKLIRSKEKTMERSRRAWLLADLPIFFKGF
jgi:hypothetical protein